MPKQSVETLESRIKALEQKREIRINKYILPLDAKIEALRDKIELVKQKHH